MVESGEICTVLIRGKGGRKRKRDTPFTMPPHIAEAIARHRAVVGPDPRDLVWPFLSDCSKNTARKVLMRDAKACGIPFKDHTGRGIGWHAFRHASGTLMAERGVGINLVKDMMGHASIQTTAKYFQPGRWREMNREIARVSQETTGGRSGDTHSVTRQEKSGGDNARNDEYLRDRGQGDPENFEKGANRRPPKSVYCDSDIRNHEPKRDSAGSQPDVAITGSRDRMDAGGRATASAASGNERYRFESCIAHLRLTHQREPRCIWLHIKELRRLSEFDLWSISLPARTCCAGFCAAITTQRATIRVPHPFNLGLLEFRVI